MPLDETEKMSQWSLTFEVRKSSPPRMCPSLSTRRNGA